ncbi:MAG: elongation factor Ts [Candidatus Vogelbacteria bacterium]|nr:elongation factor Ts [Candidatus Vogelbacteria bacterium]
MLNTDQIKALREETSISVAECKKALEEAGGDMDKARALLRERGAVMASKKADRALGAGTVGSYLHANGAMGALVVLHSETDFVGGNPEFKAFAADLAMHVAAMMPPNREEFLGQPFVKDPSQTIDQLIQGAVQKFGERIEIGQFTRLDLTV